MNKEITDRILKKKTRLFNKALKLIKEDDEILLMSDLYTALGISSSSFYEYFPANSEETETIKEALEVTRAKIKKGLRKKWYKSDTAALQISLYKLIATPEERQILSQNDVKLSGELTNNVNVMQPQPFKVKKRERPNNDNSNIED